MPIDYSLNKLKKKYGYESEDEQHSVDADTRTLLQEVNCLGFAKKFYLTDEIDYRKLIFICNNFFHDLLVCRD